jgi:CRP/FNR family transcriptional regulator, cyclic AMP receptor protein
MNPSQILTTLQSCDLFKRLEPDQHQKLAQMIELRKFKAQQPIFKCGDYGDRLWIISAGHVELRSPPPQAQPIATLHTHNVLGELALLTPGERLTTATALDAVTALELTAGSLRMLEMSDPSLAVGLLAELRHRLAPWFDTCRTLTRHLYSALLPPTHL